MDLISFPREQLLVLPLLYPLRLQLLLRVLVLLWGGNAPPVVSGGSAVIVGSGVQRGSGVQIGGALVQPSASTSSSSPLVSSAPSTPPSSASGPTDEEGANWELESWLKGKFLVYFLETNMVSDAANRIWIWEVFGFIC